MCRVKTWKFGKIAAIFLICSLVLGQLLVGSPAKAAGITIYVNGKLLKTSAEPYIQNDRVLVPFRDIFEALGASVSWDEKTRTVLGVKGDRKVKLTIDRKTAYVNDSPVTMDVAATIKGGRTFVPLRFVGEALGADVQWDGANRVVRITLAVTASGRSVSVSKTITIKDAYGNIVMVPSPARRIVVTNSNVAEAICALGAADRIVGRSSTTTFPPVLLSKTDVGSWTAPSVEKILSLKPDVVFGYGLYLDKNIIAQLKRHGIPVVLLDCYFLHSMTQDMTILGKILGKEKEAAEFNAYYMKYVNLVTERTKKIPEGKKVRLYVDYYTDYGTVGKGSASQEVLDAIGAKNIAANLGVPFPKISSEWVLAQNPQAIFKICSSTSVPSGYGKSASAMKRKYQEIIQRPGWSKIDAVKNGRILMVSGEIFTNVRTPVGMLY
ncbi:MAG: stalk domain-containing protein, partial [Thermacetogeniaceae bacterium]